MIENDIKFKYYILDMSGNRLVTGVVSEDEQGITYHAMRIATIDNAFSGTQEEVLTTYHESVERITDKAAFFKDLDRVDITTEYWRAWEHATGRKRKATARNTES